MIHPLRKLSIKGVIWYQGEGNAGRAYQYRYLFPAIIKDWRKTFSNPQLPFLYVQLANFLKPDSVPTMDPWPELREAQYMTLTVPNTAMACAIDLGEIFDIHPKNKELVGRRLGYAALNQVYGRKEVLHRGPTLESYTIVGNTVRISFADVGNGLVSRGRSDLQEFTLAGQDQKFYYANAKIVSPTMVEVSSPKVGAPVAIRFAWANNPDKLNLYNTAGLPALPFRTDSWKGVTEGKLDF